MSDNYSTLERNTLHGLSEPAGHLYLKLLDKYQGSNRSGEKRAFLEACRYDEQVGRVTAKMLQGAPHFADAETRSEVGRYLAERWMHNKPDAIAFTVMS